MGAPLDLIGQRFHKLLVLDRIPTSPGNKTVRWRCLCDCGQITYPTTGNLRSGRAYSCGCVRDKHLKTIQAQPNRPKLGMYNDTNVSRISSARASKNNALGMRGVSRTKRGKYVAFIYYKKQRTYLGTFETAEEAKAAYDEAWQERLEAARQEGVASGTTWQRTTRNLVGNRYGKLTVLSRAEGDSWNCCCDCGNQCVVREGYLLYKATQSCGCMKHSLPHEDLSGHRFGKLVAKDYVKGSKWRCICDCGNECVVASCKLKTGHTRSCGCLRSDPHKKEI